MDRTPAGQSAHGTVADCRVRRGSDHALTALMHAQRHQWIEGVWKGCQAGRCGAASRTRQRDRPHIPPVAVGCQLASKGIDTRQAANAEAGDPAAKIGAKRRQVLPAWADGGRLLTQPLDSGAPEGEGGGSHIVPLVSCA